MTDKPALTEEQKKLTLDFRVRSYEADVSQRVTIQTICNYLQEMAWQHARQLGFALVDRQDNTLAWVLLSLQVRMDAYPKWGETVRVSTWPSGRTRVHAYRDFEIRSPAGDMLGVATSSWVIIDIQRRRPVRMLPELDHCIPMQLTRALSDSFETPLPALDNPGQEQSFSVRLSDIDVNNHVNNVNFIEWAMESVPAEWRAGRRIHEIQVEFKAESNYGDTVLSQFKADQTSMCGIHRVLRKSDQKTLMLAHTKWVASD